tara:strand:+ start:274 stop:459 length:186 start_codon:yes stop_codon:yes gene_type:complete
MPPIKIDDTEYSSENLSDKAKAYLGNIQFIQTEVSKLQDQIRIYKVAETQFGQLLKDELQN